MRRRPRPAIWRGQCRRGPILPPERDVGSAVSEALHAPAERCSTRVVPSLPNLTSTAASNRRKRWVERPISANSEPRKQNTRPVPAQIQLPLRRRPRPTTCWASPAKASETYCWGRPTPTICATSITSTTLAIWLCSASSRALVKNTWRNSARSGSLSACRSSAH